MTRLGYPAIAKAVWAVYRRELGWSGVERLHNDNRPSRWGAAFARWRSGALARHFNQRHYRLASLQERLPRGPLESTAETLLRNHGKWPAPPANWPRIPSGDRVISPSNPAYGLNIRITSEFDPDDEGVPPEYEEDRREK